MTLSFNDAILLRYWAGRKTDFEFPQYLISEYGKDAANKIKFFIKEGYIRSSTPEENVKLVTIPELKKVLASKGLKTTGKKQELVDRVIENFSQEELKKLFPISKYILTEKGQAEIDNNRIYFLNKDRNYGFLNAQITAKKEELLSQNPRFTDRDVLWSLFNDKQLKESANKNWGSYYMTQYNMGCFLMEEGDHKKALNHLCIAAYIALSGMSDSNTVDEIDLVLVAPALIGSIDAVLSACNLTIDDFKDYYLNQAKRYMPRLPFTYYSYEDTADIICELLFGKEFSEIQNNYKHNIPSENAKTYKYYKFDEGNGNEYEEGITFSQDVIDGFTNAVESKIAEIDKLIDAKEKSKGKKGLLNLFFGKKRR